MLPGAEIPKKIDSLKDISLISCGEYACAVIDKDNSLWYWGGLRNREDKPKKIATISNVKKIQAGADYIIILRNDGTVWGWGEKEFLGIKENRGITEQPVKIMDDVIDISTYSEHTLALKSDGTVWAWGRNSNGQISPNKRMFGFSSIPRKIEEFEDVKSVFAGYTYSIIIKNDDSIWFLGNEPLSLYECKEPQRILDGHIFKNVSTAHC